MAKTLTDNFGVLTGGKHQRYFASAIVLLADTLTLAPEVPLPLGRAEEEWAALARVFAMLGSKASVS
jgi:hypothetical protein